MIAQSERFKHYHGEILQELNPLKFVQRAKSMAFSTILAERIRHALARKRGITEKRMFGGVGFLLHGNMLVGVWKDSLVLRLGPEASNVALKQPHVKPFDITGKPMRGWALVEPEGLESDLQLADWIDQTLQFVRTLPPK
ncbi:MAG TPA: TfoX/Sxy family protein [Planctomycetaceae bacterium]|nr:TfoX/Sxy family protein [Planctomycetaceae bacterium]HQZ68043.1 TfoX/Sxy family protein [Planctomycetaceae bacterium]